MGFPIPAFLLFHLFIFISILYFHSKKLQKFRLEIITTSLRFSELILYYSKDRERRLFRKSGETLEEGEDEGEKMGCSGREKRGRIMGEYRSRFIEEVGGGDKNRPGSRVGEK